MTRRYLALKGLALLVVLVLVGGLVGLSTFRASVRHVQIGAHDATVAPTFDGHATLDFGPVLPQVRLPVDAPLGLGVDLDLGGSEATSVNELVAQDAVIASQPEGEIERVESTVRDMARDSALRGLGAGVLSALVLAVGFRAVGRDRRRRIWGRLRHARAREWAVVGTIALAMVGSVALMAVPERVDDENKRALQWLPVREVVPSLPDDPVLDRLEVSQGAAATGGSALIAGALKIYDESVTFYGELEEKAKDVAVRTPEEGQTTALVVTDRHDNIGMDPVARAVADRADASMLIDLGDDTSGGDRWEEFSINSLARAFRGMPVVAIAGNHDVGPFIRRQMDQRGFTVLDGEPVTVGGVRFLGTSDPRGTSLLGYKQDASDNDSALKDIDAEMTQAACDAGDVSVLLSHTAAAARQVAASGCVDLVLAGHLHYQVGPKVTEGEAGLTTTLTTGTTGGAVLAFALGSELRREAQVTVVTFEDGRPVGLQPVSFEPGGQIDVEPYTPVRLSER